jgi:hypothetical protein
MIYKSPRELAREYIEGKLTDTVVEEIKKNTHEGGPTTLEEAALELVKQIPYLATKGTVDDYFRYKAIFEKKCGEDCQGDKAEAAHYEALAEMKEGIDKAGRLNWADKGEAYDHAFRNLIPKLDPLKDN